MGNVQDTRHSHINSEVYSDYLFMSVEDVESKVVGFVLMVVGFLMNGLCESMVWLCLGLHFSMVLFNSHCLVCLGVTICLLFMWFRDSIREYTSTYEILIGMFFMAYCVLVLSESLFFITFF